MKIVVATFYANHGGSNKVLLAAAAALSQRFHCILRAPLAEANSQHTLALTSSPLSSMFRKLSILPKMLMALCQEWLWLRKTKPDVLYVHDELSLYIYGLLGKILGIPVVWHIHRVIGEGFGAKLGHYFADREIAISQHGARDEAKHNGAVIYNPVTFPEGIEVRREAKPAQSLNISMAATIGERKNQSLALEAFYVAQQERPDMHLQFFGEAIDEVYQIKLRARIAELHLAERVTFHGVKPPREIFAASDVVLFPSRDENQPLALLEAIGVEKAILASDIPAHREIFEILGLPISDLLPLDVLRWKEAFCAPPRNITPEIAAFCRNIFAKEKFNAQIIEFFDSHYNIDTRRRPLVDQNDKT